MSGCGGVIWSRWSAVPLVFCMAGAPRPSAAAVSGRYISPLGDIQLKTQGRKIVGVAAQDGGPCGFQKGQNVLDGTLLDDSVTGTLTICSSGEGCGVQKVLVVLLVARKGDLLSGAVHTKQPQCRLPLGGKGIALARAPDVGKARKPRSGSRQPAESSSTPGHGQAAAPAAPTTEEINAPFENWNPGAMGGATVQGRNQALELGREAAALINRGDFEGARSVLLEALRHNVAYAEGYNMMGVTYFARDRYDDALGWYKKALTANPDFGDAYYNIACIYSVEGKKALALRYLRIAMLNGYAQPDVVGKDPDLDGLRGEKEYQEILALAGGSTEKGASTQASPPVAGPVPHVKDAGGEPDDPER